MFRHLIAVLTISVFVAGTIVSCGKQPTNTPLISLPKGGIGFVSDREGNQDIYVMNADGSNQFNVSNSRVSEVEPVWSPDGKKILFAVERSWPWEDAQLYVMDADSGNRKSLTGSYSNYIYSDQSWSPDGGRIIYWFGKTFSEGDIYIANIDGSNRSNLTNNPAFYGGIAWSPDGSKIAFIVEIENPIGSPSREAGSLQASQQWVTSREIHIMNSDGSNRVKVTSSFQPSWTLVWSPDGGKIIFWSEGVEGDNSEMYVMNADGSNQTNLTNNPAYDGGGVWSPDGSKIAFVRWDGNWDIYLMNVDGSSQVNLTNNPADDSEVAWSPDGSKIAFVSNRDGNAEIYIMNADGSGITNLTNNTANDVRPVWLP